MKLYADDCAGVSTVDAALLLGIGCYDYKEKHAKTSFCADEI